MNIFDMPSPGPISAAQKLATACYTAIQYTRIIAEGSPQSDSGDQLRAFFLACAEFCPRASNPKAEVPEETSTKPAGNKPAKGNK